MYTVFDQIDVQGTREKMFNWRMNDLSTACSFATVIGVLLLGFTSRAVHSEDDAVALLEQVRGDDFDARQAAMEKLQSMGESARPVLEKAAKSDDPETREAAAKLLAKLHVSVLRVMAFDRDGKPAAGAEADLQINENMQAKGGVRFQMGIGAQGGEAPRTLTLNDSGSAETTLAPSGGVNLNTSWKTWSVIDSQPMTWAMTLGDGLNPLVYTLSHSGSATIQVNDADGKPLKNATVALFAGIRYDADLLEEQLQRWGAVSLFNGATDEKGAATIENITAGVYQVVVRAEGYRSVVLPAQRIHQGRTTQFPAAALTPCVPGKVQVVLKDADGKPLTRKVVDYAFEPIFEGPQAAELHRNLGMLRMWGRQNKQQNPSTDDLGKVVFENVAPGKYNLLFRCNAKAPQRVGPFTVASGQALDLAEVTQAPGGGITGTVTGMDEKIPRYMYALAVPEQELIDALKGSAQVDWRYMYRDTLNVTRVGVQANGAYEMKDLAPGRYGIVISGQFGALAYIFGCNVEAGKSAKAADFAAPQDSQGLDLKGMVLLPDGKPAVGARVTVNFSGQNVWTSSTEADGAFHVQTMGTGRGEPVSVAIKLAGYKLYVVDLVHGNTKPDQISVKLEKQGFGSLHVKVVDETGKPLPGASVAASGANAARRKTNVHGEADLTGLVAGTRALEADLPGYYPEESKALVAPDVENNATIKLHTGFVVKGHLAIPTGVSAKNVSVCVQSATSFYTGVSDDGSFTFTGLMPGDYSANAAGPGLVVQRVVRFTLKPDDKAPPHLELALVRACGMALDVGKKLEGYTAILRPSGAPEPAAGAIQVTPADTVDAAGRLEFWGLAPGKYDLLLTAPTRMYNYYGRMLKAATATRVIHGIDAVAMKSAEELTATAAPVNVELGTGSVTGHIVADSLPSGNSGGNINISLKGADGISAVSFGFPHEIRPRQTAIALVGEVPAGIKAPEQGVFSIKALPPGDYSLVADLGMYHTRIEQRGNVRMARTITEDTKRDPQTLKTFTIKAGEELDLGALMFTTPPDVKVAGDANEEAESDDQTPQFQP